MFESSAAHLRRQLRKGNIAEGPQPTPAACAPARSRVGNRPWSVDAPAANLLHRSDPPTVGRCFRAAIEARHPFNPDSTPETRPDVPERGERRGRAGLRFVTGAENGYSILLTATATATADDEPPNAAPGEPLMVRP